MRFIRENSINTKGKSVPFECNASHMTPRRACCVTNSVASLVTPLPTLSRQKLGHSLRVALAFDVRFILRHAAARGITHLAAVSATNTIAQTTPPPPQTLHTKALTSLLLGIASAAAAALSLPAKSLNTGITCGAREASQASMKPRCLSRRASATLRCTPLLRTCLLQVWCLSFGWRENLQPMPMVMVPSAGTSAAAPAC